MAATLEALRGRLGQTSELDAAAALTQQATDNLATLNGAVAEMLQHGAARESKLAAISRIHGAILGVTVPLIDAVYFALIRSDTRRVGKECVRPCRYRWWPSH